ncbi:MAG: ammonium transporter [Acidimicrobiia bacterium]|nr:ammonium transporter [Acidimicrobiia bacterium]
MNNADTGWMLLSTALVLLMTPALAFFYGGLVRSKNALNTMMMSFVALGPVAVIWALLGYSLAFAPGSPVIGSLSFAGLRGVGVEAQGAIPHLLFMAFQGTFAIITPALISGAVVERMRFNAYLAFITAWVLLVYAPVAHWVWGGGFLASMGALDFAGGAVVHVNAASAALVAALVVGPRKDYGRHAILPHNVPFTMLGAGLLWFGWFGFNAGSALSAGTTASLAFANTLLAPAAALASWTLIDLLRGGTVTAVGAATAIVVGLVVVTPAAGYISPLSAIVMGAMGAMPSYFALIYRAKTKLDDSLDVVAAHGLGGATGAILTGVFADAAWSGGPSGLLAGHPAQLLTQLVSVVIVLLYSGAATLVILKALALVMPLRIDSRDEKLGLDVSDHGEEAYTHGDGAILVKPRAAAVAPGAAGVVAVPGEDPSTSLGAGGL